MKEMKSEMEIAIVPRPDEASQKSLTLRASFTKALFSTLTSGEAVAVPIRNGDNYAVARNRLASRGYAVAKRYAARFRTSHSPDGLSVLLWLEKKTDTEGPEQ